MEQSLWRKGSPRSGKFSGLQEEWRNNQLMPLYQYQAIDSSGKKRSGLIEAQGEKEAKEKLREQGIMVSKLVHKTEGSSKESLQGENLQAFTMQLSQLISAGVPLYQSLLAIE